LLYLKDFNELVSAHYDSLIKQNDLERAILGSSKGTVSDLEKVKISTKELNNSKVSLSVAVDESVESVEYVFDNNTFYPITSTNAFNGFSIVLKASDVDVFTGHANVTLKSGKIITKKFQL
jgi:hypothetical protein